MNSEQQAVFIEKLTNCVRLLRANLETLLENSDDEAQEKNLIKDQLIRLAKVFEQARFINVHQSCTYCLEKADELEAFGDSDSEEILLRFCLLLEQGLENSALGIKFDDEVFANFLAESMEDFDHQLVDQNINLKLVKVLRTVYQKQLIKLIKNMDKVPVLAALSAISRDLKQGLPQRLGKDWTLLEFYLKGLEDPSAIETQTHRLLALLDVRLAKILESTALDSVVLADLLEMVQKNKEGQRFLAENALLDDKLYVSASVYARFHEAIKDALVKLHESFERIYLDSSQRSLLLENTEFLTKLHASLCIMGFENLASLTSWINKELGRFEDSSQAVVPEQLNCIVSAYWVLETCLARLWTVKDSTLPLNYPEIQVWTLEQARLATLKVFASTYKELRDKVDKNGTTTEAIAHLQQELVTTVQAEKLLAIDHPLINKINSEFLSTTFTKEELSEIALALEYAANKNIEGGYISEAVIGHAYNLINRSSKKQGLDGGKPSGAIKQTVKKAPNSVLDSTIDMELLTALVDETNSLESEARQYINTNPMDKKSYDGLIRIAHTLKGNASIIGFTGAYEFLERLEKNLLQNTDYNAAQIVGYNKNFDAVFSKMHQFLGQILKKYGLTEADIATAVIVPTPLIPPAPTRVKSAPDTLRPAQASKKQESVVAPKETVVENPVPAPVNTPSLPVTAMDVPESSVDKFLAEFDFSGLGDAVVPPLTADEEQDQAKELEALFGIELGINADTITLESPEITDPLPVVVQEIKSPAKTVVASKNTEPKVVPQGKEDGLSIAFEADAPKEIPLAAKPKKKRDAEVEDRAIPFEIPDAAATVANIATANANEPLKPSAKSKDKKGAVEEELMIAFELPQDTLAEDASMVASASAKNNKDEAAPFETISFE